MSAGPSRTKPRVLKTQELLKKTSRHATKNDSKYIYTCEYCHKKFTQNSLYYRHISVNHSSQKKEATFKCDQCAAVFSKKALLENHCRVEHKVRSRSRCDSCTLIFKSRYCLRRHMKLKQDMRENTCTKCQKICISQKILAKHLDSKHVSKNGGYKCEECIMHFKIERSLTCHIKRIHTTEGA